VKQERSVDNILNNSESDQKAKIQVVWFKRDLRTHDNAALCEALKRGNTLPLYVIEPELWRQPDYSYRHYLFLRQTLVSLNKRLKELGQGLKLFVGSIEEALIEISESFEIETLHAHEETGNAWTFDRDLRVHRFCEDKGILFLEHQQFGVFRCLKSKRDWALSYESFMAQDLIPEPECLPCFFKPGEQTLPPAKDLGLEEDGIENIQQGGRESAAETMNSFFSSRFEKYQKGLSSPELASKHCSRLSPYLALGVISMKELVHRTRAEIRSSIGQGNRWKQKQLESYQSRLYWHCHFIQKLEMYPVYEMETMLMPLDELRENHLDLQRYEAFCTGRTGVPFVDACVRSLVATGWINFRMRAMLVSFACHQLWLPWRPVALFLARMFVDYEPGIHYPQVQMQAGTSSSPTLRIYNPVKQSQDQDPDGKFIKSWVPELSSLTSKQVHEPWNLAPLEARMRGFHVGETYPHPIVDVRKSYQEAKDKMYSSREELDIVSLIRSRKRNSREIPKPASREKQWLSNTIL